MSSPRVGNWMMTYTGKAFYPYDMRLEEFDIEDIAHALSMLCRYGGHCQRFYSVAEHSVIVSRMVPKEDALAGLMHDATEAYLVDMPRPIKVGFPQYQDMEQKIWVMLAMKFSLPVVLPESVKLADQHILWHEMKAIMAPRNMETFEEWGMGSMAPDVIRPELIRCWSPQDAKRFFMNRYLELTR